VEIELRIELHELVHGLAVGVGVGLEGVGEDGGLVEGVGDGLEEVLVEGGVGVAEGVGTYVLVNLHKCRRFQFIKCGMVQYLTRGTRIGRGGGLGVGLGLPTVGAGARGGDRGVGGLSGGVFM